MEDRQFLIDRMLRFADHFGVGAKLLLGGPAIGISTSLEPSHPGFICSQLIVAFGILTYGNQKPTLALCHHEIYWRLYYAIVPPQRYPQPDEMGKSPEWMRFQNASLTWHKDCKWRSVTILNEERIDQPWIEKENSAYTADGLAIDRWYLNGFLEMQL